HNLKAAGSNPAPATKIMPASSGPFFIKNQKSKINQSAYQAKRIQAQCAPKTNVRPSDKVSRSECVRPIS
ncbi:hypothetical protein, partial [Brucella rhizosphaerae]|uniref:hypothetical protein n=1 Tax=Brucella rhizosphaerae TaxID=571254 RepID=UPI0035BC1827